MSLTPGTRIGAYEVTGSLGAGGMGEVYRATDTNLKRQVAIKVLPAALAGDAERLARFQREAEVLAALNHPHIAAIYGLEKSGGVTALVMELVEGEDLSQRIARGAIPLDEALPIAKQIAEALEAAHEQGIVHRDLKPANIKVRADGTVKVLDFGLAKALASPASAPDMTRSPTITSPAMTQAGMILGTAAYMSPEQARGKTVDERADIWAFGCVLYEILSGRRAFGGDDVTDVIVSVVSKAPDWTPIPIRVRRLLEACLEKDPKRRLRSIADAWRLLDETSTLPGRATRPGWLDLTARIAVGALLVTLAGLAWVHYREATPDEPTVRFVLASAQGTDFNDPFGISPDGRSIVFAAVGPDNRSRLWVRPLDSLDARPLPGTEAVSPAGIFWSPDSRFIGFAADGAVKKVDVSGTSSQTLCRIPGNMSVSFRGGAWSDQGVVIFGVANIGLMQVPDSGGSPVLLTDGSGGHSSPTFLPDGRHFLYSVGGLGGTFAAGRAGIYVGALDGLPAQQSASPLISNRVAGVAYVPHQTSTVGDILFERDGALLAQPFDAETWELPGNPITVASGLARLSAAVRSFSASSGVVAYRSGRSAAVSSLLWFDRRGTQVGQVGSPDNYGNVVLSRDGSTVAVARIDSSLVGHTWTVDLARGVFSRLNPGDSIESPQAISPDGRVAFTVATGASGDIFAKRAGSAETPQLVVSSGTVKHPNDWSRDGRFLLYDDHHPSQRQDLWVVPVEGTRTPIPFLATPADESSGAFSPDGRWVVYSSDESGRREVHVRGFDPDRPSATAAGQWQISSAGGDKPRWSADGRTLFYIALDGKMTSVPVKTGSTFEPGAAVPLFDTHTTGFAPYDVAPDGRFLINTLTDSMSGSPITVIVNWQAPPK